MDSSVSPKDVIWFLCVCHHISNAVYHTNANDCFVGRGWGGVEEFSAGCFPQKRIRLDPTQATDSVKSAQNDSNSKGTEVTFMGGGAQSGGA